MIPKRKAIQFAIVNLVHCRLLPTQPFSERLPTYKRLLTYKRLPTLCLLTYQLVILLLIRFRIL
ncbi:MAG: hypothetical protein LBK82_11430 [Planctomycetaceae bacterium]|nr:hypothetical protein [Planctomycetaceae bacterium]